MRNLSLTTLFLMELILWVAINYYVWANDFKYAVIVIVFVWAYGMINWFQGLKMGGKVRVISNEALAKLFKELTKDNE